MKSKSKITREMVLEAIKLTADWPHRERDTDDIVCVVLGWRGERKNWQHAKKDLPAPPAGGITGKQDLSMLPSQYQTIEERKGMAARVRSLLTELAKEGLVHQSSRGKYGFTWYWITDADRTKSDAKQAAKANGLALAERISMHIDDERPGVVGEYNSVSCWSFETDLGGYGTVIQVRLSEQQALDYAEFLEYKARCAAEIAKARERRSDWAEHDADPTGMHSGVCEDVKGDGTCYGCGREIYEHVKLEDKRNMISDDKCTSGHPWSPLINSCIGIGCGAEKGDRRG